MTEKEYYLILPLLLYGLAVTDLINSWRSLLREEQRYIPYTLTSLLLLELAFWNFFGMYHWIQDGSLLSYPGYLKILLAPIVFILIVSVFTPEKDEKSVKEYYMNNMRTVFGLMVLFTALHFFYGHELFIWQRLTGMVLLSITAITRKVWMVYVLVVFRVILIINVSL